MERRPDVFPIRERRADGREWSGDPAADVGYMEPYATAHQALDEDKAFQEEVLNVARALGNAVRLSRAGKLENPAKCLIEPKPK